MRVGAKVFLSTPSARRATSDTIANMRRENDFYPRPPRGGRLRVICFNGSCWIISIHALREEGDISPSGVARVPADFYPRPPRGGRPERPGILPEAGYFYPRPPRGGRQIAQEDKAAEVYFYPRPPRGGRHKFLFKGKFDQEKFLSTPSARRATAKTETKSLFSNKLYNILHEFRRALIYNGSKNYPNHAK